MLADAALDARLRQVLAVAHAFRLGVDAEGAGGAAQHLLRHRAAEVRERAAGHDRGDADAPAVNLLAQAVADRVHGVLGGAVDLAGLAGAPSGHARDVDDVPAAARLPRPDRLAAADQEW